MKGSVLLRRLGEGQVGSTSVSLDLALNDVTRLISFVLWLLFSLWPSVWSRSRELLSLHLLLLCLSLLFRWLTRVGNFSWCYTFGFSVWLESRISWLWWVLPHILCWIGFIRDWSFILALIRWWQRFRLSWLLISLFLSSIVLLVLEIPNNRLFDIVTLKILVFVEIDQSSSMMLFNWYPLWKDFCKF